MLKARIALVISTVGLLCASIDAGQAASRPRWCSSQESMNLAERTICETRGLWELDDRLNIIYRGALESVGSQRGRLQRSQEDWVRVTRNGCNADDSCLTDVYERRIDVLRRIDNRGHMNPNE